MPSEAVIVAVVAAFPGLVGAYFAYRQSIKAAQKSAETRTLEVEAGAYDRARSLYEKSIRQLEAQIERLEEQVSEERYVSSRLRLQIRDLERTVALLRKQIINCGIDLDLPPSQD